MHFLIVLNKSWDEVRLCSLIVTQECRNVALLLRVNTTQREYELILMAGLGIEIKAILNTMFQISVEMISWNFYSLGTKRNHKSRHFGGNIR